MWTFTFKHLIYIGIYIGTGSLFTLLVKQSTLPMLSTDEDDNGKGSSRASFSYNPIAVTFCVELFKWCATTLYIFIGQFYEAQYSSSSSSSPSGSILPSNSVSTSFTSLFSFMESKYRDLRCKWSLAKLFLVPAFLYFLFNSLAFYNLQFVSPSTYRLLINLKVLFSGLLLQIILHKHITRRQWLGLFLLVLACSIEQFDKLSTDFQASLWVILSICFQSFCSSLAGVYFQYLLQFTSPLVKESAELGLWEKNFFMYTWSVLFNLLYLFLFSPATFWSPLETVSQFQPIVLPIILCSAIGGFSTSLILRDLDVIVKEYANFAEMCVVVFGSFLWLGIPLKFSLFVAIAIVTVSLYLYNVQPPQKTDKAELNAVEKEELLSKK